MRATFCRWINSSFTTMLKEIEINHSSLFAHLHESHSIAFFGRKNSSMNVENN